MSACGCDQEARWVCAQHRDVFDDVIAERDHLRERLDRAQHAETWWRDQYFVVERKWHVAEQQVAMLNRECEDSSREADQWLEKAEELGDQVATLTEALRQSQAEMLSQLVERFAAQPHEPPCLYKRREGHVCICWIGRAVEFIKAALAAVRGER